MTDTTTTDTTDTDTTDEPRATPDKPKPLFTDFGVDQDLADALRERGIIHPFAIQELSLPLGLKGHDIIGQARTGTGKTLGFGLPLLQRIDPDKAKTQALVIVPTRELCIQVADDLTVGSTRGITSIAVYGGVGYEEQIEALTTGVHVVVGTPGRTLDHLGRGNLDVSQIHTVVLDEADEMLDMGFLPDVEKLLADVPVDRQTLLFSATMPTAIVKLARRFMAKPTFMRADETLHETAPTVDQHFFLVHRMDKPRVLARLLQMPGRGGAFVFCRTKRMCDRLVRELEPLGVSAIAVHGDLRQSTREKNLDQFRAGKADVLVATEVAARGLDVSNVTHVINYDCPDDEKMYLHRIGRTARAGESGVAVTFGEFNEVDRVNVIRKRVGVEDELTEVFSTSSLLTELFDLPETTPWDDFGKSDDGGRGSRGGSGRSGGSRSSSGGGTRSSGGGRSSSGGGSSSSGGGTSSSRGDDRSSSRKSRRSSASSSGSNRSSGRGSDRRGGEGDEHEQRRTSADNDSSRSRTRTRTRSRTGSRTERDTNSSSRDSSSRDSSGRDSSGRDSSSRDSSSRDSSSRDRREADSTSSSRNGGGSNGRRTDDSRGRGDHKDSGRGRRDRGTNRPSDEGGNDRSAGRSKDDGTGTSRTNESSGRTTGGARKRARRGRRSQDQQRDDATSSRASSSTDSGTGSRDSGSTSSDGGGASRRGGRGRDDRSRSNRGRSSDGDRSGRGASNGRTDETASTTRRGSDARGSGTPRLDRRVDVEHLP